MKRADRVAATTRSAAVPSLGVQLRAPPGGDVCSLARRISVVRSNGAACMKLPIAFVSGSCSCPCFVCPFAVRRKRDATGPYGNQWKSLGNHQNLVPQHCRKQHVVGPPKAASANYRRATQGTPLDVVSALQPQLCRTFRQRHFNRQLQAQELPGFRSIAAQRPPQRAFQGPFPMQSHAR